MIMPQPSYPLFPALKRPDFKGNWHGVAWRKAPVLNISQFRPESSDHRPVTDAKLLYGMEGLYGMFRVQDRFVRCVHRRFQDPVFQDSCVEFFVQPCDGKGYFNFEFNCGGTLRASYIIDPARAGSGFKSFTRLGKQESRQIRIFQSLPRLVEPECMDPVTWYLEFYIPYALLEKYLRHSPEIAPGTIWRANLFKCADHCSHPHWAAWSAVDELNFHLPHCFGKLEFMGP